MKASKKILGATVALVGAVALSAGSTFAWFTSNMTVGVTLPQMNVTSGTEGLYVGVSKTTVDATEFSETLDASILSEVIGNALKLDAVTAHSANSEGQVGITGAAVNALKKSNGAAAAANTEYVEFKLTFRSTAPMNVYLKASNTSATSTGKSVAKPEGLTLTNYGASEDSTTITTNSANACRVSFSVGSTHNIWEPNSTAGYYNYNLAEDYKKAILGQNVATATPKTLLPASLIPNDEYAETAKICTTAAPDSSAGTYQAEVTVRIWLEGTDGDCFNVIYNDTLTVALSFAGSLVA